MNEIRAETYSKTSFRSWLDNLCKEDRAKLFELEMWIKSFDCFFRIKNHPLSEQEQNDIVSKNFIEELKITKNVMLRMSYLANELISAESLGANRFDRYIEAKLCWAHSAESSLETTLWQTRPEESLALLNESLTDLRVLIDELANLPKLSLQAFTSIGKIVNREIKRCRYIELLLAQNYYRPQLDYLANSFLSKAINAIEDEVLRKEIVKVLLDFFRLLKYLDFVAVNLAYDRPLKDSLLIFSLIYSETQLLLEYLENRLLKNPNLPPNGSNAIDGCTYALQMDLKKVFGRELVGFAHLNQAPPIYTKVENSHGLLRDCFQQSVVSIVQIFQPDFDGTQLFETFQTKLEQSLRLRMDIWRLLCQLRKFEQAPDENKLPTLIEHMTVFRDTSLKSLMYKDWDDYERLMEQSITARNLDESIKAIHIFSTFLEALLGQINLRAVIANHPFDYPEL
ncbi:MAG: hypothetical protein RMM17_03605 [Acidobacteriota bacterium]|nr:hypothetical protein [Blastocatellia bacterium]MDW8411754.1 hypothetical protein [Acidobacteriota bacterium]